MAISQRDIVLARDNHTCQECGATPDKLHVHHLAYGTDDLADLITLCPACHKLRHKTRPSTRAARATTVATYKLPEKDMALLANLSKRYGVSRPAIVRMAIRYLDEHGPIRAKEGRVDDYTRRLDEPGATLED